jgi:hypothetical protein
MDKLYKRSSAWLLCAALGAAVPAAHAIDPMIVQPMYGVIGANNALNSFGKHWQRQHAHATAPRSAAVNTVIAYREPALAPATLAAAYPVAQRAQAERSLGEVLQQYHALEDRLGIPRYDLAGAVAAFVAGNYMVMRDVTVPDEDFKVLVKQLRQTVASAPEFQRASAADRQLMYEELAIVGLSMAVTHQAMQPTMDAATREKAQSAARGYLQRFLGADAERLRITAAGLSLA